MKAVIYARYSSERQTEQSIEGQLRDCHEYAEKHNLEVVATYIDRAVSGKTDAREQFQKMIKDSDKHLFEAVVVYKMDRFTRNRYDSAIYTARLKKNGVRVLYAKESIPDGPEGIILESLLEGMAEYYSEELSQKTRRGMHESALKCHATGRTGFGYKISEDKSFAIVEKEALIVKKIFQMYDSGCSSRDICKALNGIGAKTVQGGHINYNSVRRILKNEKYTGVYIYDEVRIEDGIPAIIDRDIFERVQKRMEVRKRSPGRKKAKVNYLLSGKLYCGKCEAGMIGECGTGKSGDRHYYYTCSNRKKK